MFGFFVLVACTQSTSTRGAAVCAVTCSFNGQAPHQLAQEIQATLLEDALSIDISSEFGIGKATVTLSEGSWPSEIILRLHLKGLEGLEIKSSAMRFEKSSLVVKLCDENGQLLDGKYIMDGKGYYKVDLPQSLTPETVRSFDIHWVDFYR